MMSPIVIFFKVCPWTKFKFITCLELEIPEELYNPYSVHTILAKICIPKGLIEIQKGKQAKTSKFSEL